MRSMATCSGVRLQRRMQSNSTISPSSHPTAAMPPQQGQLSQVIHSLLPDVTSRRGRPAGSIGRHRAVAAGRWSGPPTHGGEEGGPPSEPRHGTANTRARHLVVSGVSCRTPEARSVPQPFPRAVAPVALEPDLAVSDLPEEDWRTARHGRRSEDRPGSGRASTGQAPSTGTAVQGRTRRRPDTEFGRGPNRRPVAAVAGRRMDPADRSVRAPGRPPAGLAGQSRRRRGEARWPPSHGDPTGAGEPATATRQAVNTRGISTARSTPRAG